MDTSFPAAANQSAIAFDPVTQLFASAPKGLPCTINSPRNPLDDSITEHDLELYLPTGD